MKTFRDYYLETHLPAKALRSNRSVIFTNEAIDFGKLKETVWPLAKLGLKTALIFAGGPIGAAVATGWSLTDNSLKNGRLLFPGQASDICNAQAIHGVLRKKRTGISKMLFGEAETTAETETPKGLEKLKELFEKTKETINKIGKEAEKFTTNKIEIASKTTNKIPSIEDEFPKNPDKTTGEFFLKKILQSYAQIADYLGSLNSTTDVKSSAIIKNLIDGKNSIDNISRLSEDMLDQQILTYEELFFICEKLSEIEKTPINVSLKQGLDNNKLNSLKKQLEDKDSPLNKKYGGEELSKDINSAETPKADTKTPQSTPAQNPAPAASTATEPAPATEPSTATTTAATAAAVVTAPTEVDEALATSGDPANPNITASPIIVKKMPEGNFIWDKNEEKYFPTGLGRLGRSSLFMDLMGFGLGAWGLTSGKAAQGIKAIADYFTKPEATIKDLFEFKAAVYGTDVGAGVAKTQNVVDTAKEAVSGKKAVVKQVIELVEQKKTTVDGIKKATKKITTLILEKDPGATKAYQFTPEEAKNLAGTWKEAITEKMLEAAPPEILEDATKTAEYKKDVARFIEIAYKETKVTEILNSKNPSSLNELMNLETAIRNNMFDQMIEKGQNVGGILKKINESGGFFSKFNPKEASIYNSAFERMLNKVTQVEINPLKSTGNAYAQGSVIGKQTLGVIGDSTIFSTTGQNIFVEAGESKFDKAMEGILGSMAFTGAGKKNSVKQLVVMALDESMGAGGNKYKRKEQKIQKGYKLEDPERKQQLETIMSLFDKQSIAEGDDLGKMYNSLMQKCGFTFEGEFKPEEVDAVLNKNSKTTKEVLDKMDAVVAPKDNKRDAENDKAVEAAQELVDARQVASDKMKILLASKRGKDAFKGFVLATGDTSEDELEKEFQELEAQYSAESSDIVNKLFEKYDQMDNTMKTIKAEMQKLALSAPVTPQPAAKEQPTQEPAATQQPTTEKPVTKFSNRKKIRFAKAGLLPTEIRASLQNLGRAILANKNLTKALADLGVSTSGTMTIGISAFDPKAPGIPGGIVITEQVVINEEVKGVDDYKTAKELQAAIDSLKSEAEKNSNTKPDAWLKAAEEKLKELEEKEKTTQATPEQPKQDETLPEKDGVTLGGQVTGFIDTVRLNRQVLTKREFRILKIAVGKFMRIIEKKITMRSKDPNFKKKIEALKFGTYQTDETNKTIFKMNKRVQFYTGNKKNYLVIENIFSETETEFFIETVL
jgi:hypothetical protein